MFLDEIYLTNPSELVPAQQILDNLAKQTEIRINKTQIYELWRKHCNSSKFDNENEVGNASNLSCSFLSGHGLPLLIQHPDPRWASMNIMGQFKFKNDFLVLLSVSG